VLGNKNNNFKETYRFPIIAGYVFFGFLSIFLIGIPFLILFSKWVDKKDKASTLSTTSMQQQQQQPTQPPVTRQQQSMMTTVPLPSQQQQQQQQTSQATATIGSSPTLSTTSISPQMQQSQQQPLVTTQPPMMPPVPLQQQQQQRKLSPTTSTQLQTSQATATIGSSPTLSTTSISPQMPQQQQQLTQPLVTTTQPPMTPPAPFPLQQPPQTLPQATATIASTTSPQIPQAATKTQGTAVTTEKKEGKKEMVIGIVKRKGAIDCPEFDEAFKKSLIAKYGKDTSFVFKKIEVDLNETFNGIVEVLQKNQEVKTVDELFFMLHSFPRLCEHPSSLTCLAKNIDSYSTQQDSPRVSVIITHKSREPVLHFYKAPKFAFDASSSPFSPLEKNNSSELERLGGRLLSPHPPKVSATATP